MLQFTQTQATIILVTVLAICGLSIPNFVSDETIEGWPAWAQRRITVAPELQGGTSVLLEVDRDDVREQVLSSLSGEVRDSLHNNHINLARPITVRNGSVEVRPLVEDFNATLAKLEELSRPFNGVRTVEATDAGGGLIRLTPTEATVREYEPPIVDQAIGSIRARIFGVRPIVEREGANRIRLQVPRLQPEEIHNRMITF
jgi:preprotein translocase subunit SecD